MTQLTTSRIALSTGITLNVQAGGPRDSEAIFLLHGFPESHRTWRAVVPDLARDHFVAAPDQRGFGGSDRPQEVDAYRADKPVAHALGIDRFTLVGHDWGGAIAWAAALRHPERIRRLIIINAPHPYIFQRSLIEDPEQRAASQYIRAFRNPAMEMAIAAMGLGTFFDKSFGAHADLSKISADERQAYLDDWAQEGALTAMLNWYRAADIVVPAPDEEAEMPAWAAGPFPPVTQPTLVVWGMQDKALLPIQLEGLDALVPRLKLVRIEEAGHFVPWEHPEPVVAAIREFLASN
jgi:pimeloyl-ACP methyl ester carboxylesterase